ncbi:MAG: hypothetical protein SH850_17810 [Planctomycetaceae bacterium]|nr:hypothetical protein [Planctomycetaceae bacterium]
MNWQHLQTLLWVRWRLTVNHIRRHGATNLIILSIVSGLALVGSITGFFIAIIAGMHYLPGASPVVLMYLCDGWVLAFLFFWTLGVITDLQRGEMLSLDKLLHLPTTLTEVFLFNFLSSLVSLSTLTLVPPMLGLCIAAAWTKGPAALVMFPLLAAFVLMVSAVTYQFRGWLATLMTNKRRQRTVIVIVTFLFVFTMQAPQLISFAVQRQVHRSRDDGLSDREELRRKIKAREITPEEYASADKVLDEQAAARNQAALEQVSRVVEWTNLALPIGWFPYGAKAGSAGNPWPGLVGMLGLTGIAAFCLRRSYDTTLRYFTGDYTGEIPQASVIATKAKTAKAPGSQVNPIEWSFPLVSEPVAAIACATFRSLARAPEVKMVLIGPVVMLVIFGGMLLPNLGPQGMPSVVRSFLPLGVLFLSISGLAQLSQNLFAFDRSGFRAYVLSGVPRRQILIGKNLAFAPLILAPSLLLIAVVQFLAPAPATHFLATLLEIPTICLLLCLLGNFSSILCPVCQAAGSMKPANASGITMLLQFAFLLATVAVLGVVAVLPVGLELLLQAWGWFPRIVPLALIVAAVELAAAVLIYRVVIRRQGELLQSRECRILESVVEKGE